MPEKIPIGPEKLYRDSFSLAKKIHEDDYHPDLLVGVWRGGTPPAIAISEYMTYQGIDHFHTSLKSEAYTDIGEKGKVRLDGVESVVKRINEGDYERILLVDDINDTGKTLKKITDEINSQITGSPEIRTAVLYERSDKEHELESDYVEEYIEEWLVFPHELEGLSKEEIMEKKEWLSDL